MLGNAEKYSPAERPDRRRRSTGTGAKSSCASWTRVRASMRPTCRWCSSPSIGPRAPRQQSGGLGLGLAVCKRLIELQGGRSGRVPAKCGGAEFGFSLPALAEEHDDWHVPAHGTGRARDGSRRLAMTTLPRAGPGRASAAEAFADRVDHRRLDRRDAAFGSGDGLGHPEHELAIRFNVRRRLASEASRPLRGARPSSRRAACRAMCRVRTRSLWSLPARG